MSSTTKQLIRSIGFIAVLASSAHAQEIPLLCTASSPSSEMGRIKEVMFENDGKSVWLGPRRMERPARISASAIYYSIDGGKVRIDATINRATGEMVERVLDKERPGDPPMQTVVSNCVLRGDKRF